MKHTLLPLAAFAILAGCTQAPPPVVDNREADAKAIAAVEDTAMKGWAARNAEQIGSAYAPGASLIVPNTPTIKGSDVAVGMKEMLADPNVSLKFASSKTEVSKSGDLAYTEGAYTMTMSDPKSKKVLTEKGRYVSVFAKQADGNWKIVSDINTTDGPPTPADAKK